jgi:F-type H+-transporting ATPase subunit delta
VRAPIIAERYAEALLGIGLERKSVEQLGRELDRVAELFKQAPELRELFRNPKFDADVRKRVMGELLQRVLVSPTVRNFLNLLIDRHRIAHLEDITTAFHALADEKSGRIRAEVISARALGPAEQARLRTILQKVTGKQVVLDERQDPSIIGGVITRVGDRVYDGSVRSRLEGMRNRLKQARV